VVGAGTGLHSDHSRGYVGEELEQLLALEGFAKYDLLVRIDAADGERILGQVDAEADNAHGSPHSLFGRANNLHSGTSMPKSGEVHVIRRAAS